tara:strand:+ start:334 stop:573 length:240 start_codon:yes stop_codon:yes gene_type:complete
MKISFGMAEILVILAYFFYNVSFTYSLTCFIIGLSIKLFHFVLEFNRKNQMEETIVKFIEDLLHYFKHEEKSEKKVLNS